MLENNNDDFETFLKASSPYKGLKFFDKTFDYLAEKIIKAKKQFNIDLFNEALGDFILYTQDHFYGVNKTTIISYKPKLHVNEYILANITEDEYRNKANQIIKGHIKEKTPSLKHFHFKGFVLDVKY